MTGAMVAEVAIRIISGRPENAEEQSSELQHVASAASCCSSLSSGQRSPPGLDLIVNAAAVARSLRSIFTFRSDEGSTTLYLSDAVIVAKGKVDWLGLRSG